MPSVKRTKRAGVFEVSSSQPGVSYTVEVDLKASRGAAPGAIVRNCECMGHVQKGPICKHPGAVLYALASESRGRAKQILALPAARAVSSPA
eukprot:1256913-Alexandrium_andersonii.AAC.1